jgi:hypothetical protein
MTRQLTDSYLTDDAMDRRAALEAAVAIFGEEILPVHANSVLSVADGYYRWIRQRDSLITSLSITAGAPEPQGT